MRGLRSTLALAVVLAGLGAYIYFVTNKKVDDTGTPKLERVFASLASDNIDEITVKSESGDTTTMRRTGPIWHITSPVTASVDEMAIASLTNGLSSLELSRVIDENPTDLNAYGLATPRVEVDFKIIGDDTARKLMLGEKSPTGAQLFAKRNDEKRVFLVPAYQDTTFNKATLDLRDKTLLKFDREKADGIELVADGKTVQLVKSDADWKMLKPLQTKADTGAVEALVGRLQAAQAKSIAAESVTPADLKKFGLDKPSVTVNVNVGSARSTVVLGSVAPDKTVYARDLSKGTIVTIEGSLADDLKKGAGEYRAKELFEFRPYNTSHVEITRNGQAITFDLTKGTGANALGTWKRTSPNPADLNHDKMETFLTRLSNLRATSFVDSTAKTGLDKPVFTVKATFDDSKHNEAAFGRAGSDIYASRPGEAGAAKVEAADFDDMLKALDEVAK